MSDMYEAIKTTKYITGRKVGCEELPQQLKKEKSAQSLYKIPFTELKHVNKKKLHSLEFFFAKD